MLNISRRTFIKTSATALLPLYGANKAFGQSSAWTSAAEMPLNLQELYPAVHLGRLYVAGGIAAKLGVPYFTRRCISYNPKANSWRDEPDLPEELHHAALVSDGKRLFLVGGFNGAYSHVWRMRANVYELVEDKWQKVGTLPNPQAEGVLAAAPDGAIHLVSGQSPKGSSNSERNHHQEVTTHLTWKPGEECWHKLPAIPTARNSATGGWVGNQLVVSGGRTSAGNLNQTEVYDLGSAKWRTAAPIPKPQAGTASVIVEDGLVVFGGEIFVPKAEVFANVWHYSLSKDEWQALPQMLTPRHGIGAGRFGEKVYVVGGATQPSGKGTSALNEVLDLSSTALVYNPISQQPIK